MGTIHWDPTINLGTVLVGLPMLLMIGKIYGDWRVIKVRINLMWVDYCKDHNLGFTNLEDDRSK